MSSLVKIYYKYADQTDRVIGRFNKVSSLYRQKVNSSYHPYYRYCCEYSVVLVHDIWSRFCRDIIIESAYSQPITATGRRIPKAPGISDKGSVLDKIKRFNGNSAIFPWHITIRCTRLSNRLRLNNSATINTSLVTTPSYNYTISLIRNFFVHKNKISADKMRKHFDDDLSFPFNYDPTGLITDINPSGTTNLEEWVNWQKTIARNAVQ